MGEVYWQSPDGSLKLYLGDALQILPNLIGHAVVTDPPYNAGVSYGPGTDDNRDEAEYLSWLRQVFCMCAHALRGSGPIVWFWQGIRVARGDVVRVLPFGYRVHHVAAWFKQEFAGDLFKHDHPAYCWEPIIWAVPERVPARYYGPRGGHVGRDGLLANHPQHDGGVGTDQHPCAKPLSVVQAVTQWVTPPGGTVIDPFAGSGTTLIAAYRLGLSGIGIEIEERYCEVAARRLERECQQLRLALR